MADTKPRIKLEPLRITLKNGSTITTRDIINDGIAFCSAAYPPDTRPWYRRWISFVRVYLFRRRLSKASLETMKITIRGR